MNKFLLVAVALYLALMLVGGLASLQARALTMPIEKEYVEKIFPKIKKWLDFYQLDISKFRQPASFTGQVDSCFYDIASIDTTSLYYKKFREEDDIYFPQLYDYSPDGLRYINILSSSGVFFDADQTLHYEGGDDCQEIYLTDRQHRTNNMILWFGLSERAEGAFWVDNQTFVIVGYAFGEAFRYKIIIFDTHNSYLGYFEYETDMPPDKYFFNNVLMKEKQVITE